MKNRSRTGDVLDPVSAYDRIAPHYGGLSRDRQAYLTGIEGLVVSETPAVSRSLLDVGAGDGARCFRIAAAAGLTKVVLLEPSAAMRSLWPSGAHGWAIRAEELSTRNDRFDVIVCLWNVLGHIFPAARRVEVLAQCARLLSPAGRLFVDVSHRYNAVHYGVVPTMLRMIRDSVHPGRAKRRRHGRSWDINGISCATQGHVFTDAEFRRIAAAARLSVLRRFAVDYSSGRVRSSKYAGHLLYVLRSYVSGNT